jgi:hypothetical protein
LGKAFKALGLKANVTLVDRCLKFQKGLNTGINIYRGDTGTIFFGKEYTGQTPAAPYIEYFA